MKKDQEQHLHDIRAACAALEEAVSLAMYDGFKVEIKAEHRNHIGDLIPAATAASDAARMWTLGLRPRVIKVMS